MFSLFSPFAPVQVVAHLLRAQRDPRQARSLFAFLSQEGIFFAPPCSGYQPSLHPGERGGGGARAAWGLLFLASAAFVWSGEMPVFARQLSGADHSAGAIIY